MSRAVAHAALALLLWTSAAATAEVRQIEAEGAVLLTAPTGSGAPPRDEAVRRALVEAVSRVAMDLMPDADESTIEYLPEVLGNEPLAYATRYRVIDDLGERPAISADAPPGSFEYVVLVEAHIDATRVASRLAKAGLLAPPSQQRASGGDVMVVVEGVDSFAAYASLRRALLEGVRVERAIPVELSRDRVVLQVSATQGGPRRLLEDLLRVAPPELVVTPVGVGADVLKLRIGLENGGIGAAGGAVGAPIGGAAPGD